MPKTNFHHFKTDISDISLPEKFTFPFYYEPHPLCKIASKEIQAYLKAQTDFKHPFGLDQNDKENAIGKMFGVLVVKNQEGAIGYLAAFSGKLSDNSFPKTFVPPIFNRYQKDSFFELGETQLNQLNQEIGALENNPEFCELQKEFQQKKTAINKELQIEKEKFKTKRNQRKTLRKNAEKTLSKTAFHQLKKQLEQESFRQQFFLKELTHYRQQQLSKIEEKLSVFTTKINSFKKERKALSNQLQAQLFEQYQFLNQQQKTKNVLTIFKDAPNGIPPSGAGDCAAPMGNGDAGRHHRQMAETRGRPGRGRGADCGS